MRNPKIDLALVGRLLRRRWQVLTAIALIGALLGVGLSFVFSPGYVASSKVLLLGDRDKDQLPGESEVATSSIVLDRTAAALGWDRTGRDLRGEVSATVDLNVIEISGAAETPERARQLTDQVTTQYVAFSGQLVGADVTAPAGRSPAELQRRIDDATNRVKQFRSSPSADAPGAEGDRVRGEIDRAQEDVRRASEDLKRVDGQSGSGSDSAAGGIAGSVIEPATLPTGPASPSMIDLVVGGALVLVVAGVFGHLVLLRLDPRLREPDEVSAALGTPVLGCVEVPCIPQAPSGSRLRRLLHDDLAWIRTDPSPMEDADTRQARYRRVLGHLRAERRAPTGPLDVLMVTVDGDTTALPAVTELVLAGTGYGPVRLVDHDGVLGDAVLREAGRRDVDHLVSAGPDLPSGDARATFEAVSVSLANPLVPDTGSSGAVLVLTLGTRDGLDLATLAAACTDAGRPLRGAVLVTPRWTDDPEGGPADSADAPSSPATAGAGA